MLDVFWCSLLCFGTIGADLQLIASVDLSPACVEHTQHRIYTLSYASVPSLFHLTPIWHSGQSSCIMAHVQVIVELLLQVFTLWQAAMAGVTIFPYSSCAMTQLIDILAEEAGEPTALDVQAAVKHFSLADEGCYDLVSIQNHIYNSRAHAAYATNM